MASKIEWTDECWNPVRGCSRVSEGCRHCYAERIAGRFSGPGQPYEGFAKGGPKDYHGQTGAPRTNGTWRWTGRVELIASKLEEPLHWRKPRRVFVNSMSDLFHEALSDEAIDRVFAVMALAQDHTFQVLTKRAERMRDYFKNKPGFTRAALWAEIAMSVGSRRVLWRCPDGSDRMMFGLTPEPSDDIRFWPGYPFPNVWLGVSVEDQKTADERIPLLRQTPSAVRFVSVEPMLEQIDLCLTPGSEVSGPEGADRGMHWVIVGGESGPGARPMDLAWVRSVIRQCREASVPCFVKQLGSEWARWNRPRRTPEGHLSEVRYHSKGGDPGEWPEDLRVREWPA